MCVCVRACVHVLVFFSVFIGFSLLCLSLSLELNTAPPSRHSHSGAAYLGVRAHPRLNEVRDERSSQQARGHGPWLGQR